MLWCNGITRTLEYLPVTVNIGGSGQNASRSSMSASPLRRPVAASSPIRVCMLAASSGGETVFALLINAWICSGEYKYGVRRVTLAVTRPAGINSAAAASSVWTWAANPRIALRRATCQRRAVPGGAVANASASATVIVPCPRARICSMKLTSSQS